MNDVFRPFPPGTPFALTHHRHHDDVVYPSDLTVAELAQLLAREGATLEVHWVKPPPALPPAPNYEPFEQEMYWDGAALHREETDGSHGVHVRGVFANTMSGGHPPFPGPWTGTVTVDHDSEHGTSWDWFQWGASHVYTVRHLWLVSDVEDEDISVRYAGPTRDAVDAWLIAQNTMDDFYLPPDRAFVQLAAFAIEETT